MTRAHDNLPRVVGATGDVVCERCLVADSYLLRLRGLLGRQGISAGEGLLLRPCGSVHTWFLGFPIDVVFLDKELTVLRVLPRMGKWRKAGARRAKAVLELAAGEIESRGVRPGDRLIVEEGDGCA